MATDVIEIGSGVAVVAEQYWQAKTAAEALTVEWETVALSKLNSAEIRADYQAALAADDAVSATDDGDVEGALTAANQVLEAVYWTPYLSHAPMEPIRRVHFLDTPDWIALPLATTIAPTGPQPRSIVATALDPIYKAAP